MTLCQDGCCLGCSLLIPTLYGPGQAPCQLFCRGRESHCNPTLATSPSPSGHLPLPFSIKSPGLQGRSTLGLGALSVGTSRGLGGETGRVSGPRAGGKLSLPRRKDVGWAGGLFEIWPPTEYTPDLVPHGVHTQASAVSPQASSTFVSPLLSSAHARALPWPSLGPCTPRRSVLTPLRVALGSFLGSGVLLASFAAQSHLQPSSTGAGPPLLACISPLSQPRSSLGLTAEPAEVSRSPAVKVASFQGTRTSLLALPSAQSTLG